MRSDPKRLFLIDGAGALLSTLMLAVVLVRFESFFGMPKTALYVLASVPVGFALYDAVSYLARRTNVGRSLKAISLLNASYCVLSVAMLAQHAGSLTIWGWLYFLGELGVVLALSRYEWNVGKHVSR